MSNGLGEALAAFHDAVEALREGVAPYPDLSDQLFADADGWWKLLVYKLLPHLEGEGCLVVAVAGGTNTGKSTVFNLLLGRPVSPVRTTAAATCRPVLVGNAHRAAQCLEGKLVPEFAPMPLDDPEAAVSEASPPETLFVVEDEGLPGHLVLLDIPDIDSINQQNWEVAENIQAAGDVLVAVVTGEKYRDDRVVRFFEAGREAGRVVIPLMNKANPAEDYVVARAQLDDFAAAVDGLEGPRFAVPHDFDIAETCQHEITALDGGPPLLDHLAHLDVPQIKARVYRDSVARFTGQALGFVERAGELGASLDAVADEFEARAAACAAGFDPQPDEKVGKLLHGFIRARRGLLGRTVGRVGDGMGRALSPVGRWLRTAIQGRVNLERPAKARSAEELRSARAQDIEVRCRNLLREYVQTAANLAPPAGHLVQRGLDALDNDPVVARCVEQSLGEEDLSEAFRNHVRNTLDAWWADNRIRRQLLLELDTLLLVTPTAIAVPMAFYTGGVGVPEAMAAAGPVAGEFFARVMQHQLADKWFDLVAPWRREQQDRFREALIAEVTRPVLGDLAAARAPFAAEGLAAMARLLTPHAESGGKG